MTSHHLASSPSKRRTSYAPTQNRSNAPSRTTISTNRWANTLHRQRRKPDLQTTNHGTTALDSTTNGIYITPSLSWVRTAYAAIDIQPKNMANNRQATER